MDELLLDFYSSGILELGHSRQKDSFLQNLIKVLSHCVEDLLIFKGMLLLSVSKKCQVRSSVFKINLSIMSQSVNEVKPDPSSDKYL